MRRSTVYMLLLALAFAGLFAAAAARELQDEAVDAVEGVSDGEQVGGRQLLARKDDDDEDDRDGRGGGKGKGRDDDDDEDDKKGGGKGRGRDDDDDDEDDRDGGKGRGGKGRDDDDDKYDNDRDDDEDDYDDDAEDDEEWKKCYRKYDRRARKWRKWCLDKYRKYKNDSRYKCVKGQYGKFWCYRKDSRKGRDHDDDDDYKFIWKFHARKWRKCTLDRSGRHKHDDHYKCFRTKRGWYCYRKAYNRRH